MTAFGWLSQLLAVAAGVCCANVARAYSNAIRLGAPARLGTLWQALQAGARPPRRASGQAAQPASGRARGFTPPRPGACLAVACAALMCLAWLPFSLEPSLPAASRGAACAVLLMLAVIDARCHLLPDALTLPLLGTGVLLAAAGVSGLHVGDAVVAAAAGYLLLSAINAAFRAWRGHDGLGGGDMKLVAALGAWLGWQPMPLLLLLASLAAIAYSLPRRAWRAPLPFGPFLAGAAAVGLWGGPVVQLVFCLGNAVCTRSA